METLSGDEFVLSGNVSDLIDLGFYTDYEKEVPNSFLYNQNEFADTYGYCLCTIYGPMTSLSLAIGRELTRDERLELVKLRHSAPDFNKNSGGLVSVGVDIARSWWNRNHPDDLITTMMTKNNDTKRLDLLAKNIPITSGYSGNQKYNEDIQDGKLDGVEFGKPTYGHCITYIGQVADDNYNNRYTMPGRTDFLKLYRNSVLHQQAFVFIRNNTLTDEGKKLIQRMRE